MQQHGLMAVSHALTVLLRSPLLLLLGLLLVCPPPLAAAPGPATPGPATPRGAASPPKPAGEAEMTLYSGIAAVNVCIARSAGVGFDQAVAIAGETIAQLIQGQHGSVISLVGSQPLSLDELRRGAMNAAVLGAVEICPQQVPADVLQSVQATLRQGSPREATPGQTSPRQTTPTPAASGPGR